MADKVIPIVISNAKGRWRIPLRFQGKFAESANAIGSSVALDFGYLLFHMPDYSQEDIIKIFPKSHPYMLSLHCIRDLTHFVPEAYSGDASPPPTISKCSLPRSRF